MKVLLIKQPDGHKTKVGLKMSTLSLRIARPAQTYEKSMACKWQLKERLLKVTTSRLSQYHKQTQRCNFKRQRSKTTNLFYRRLQIWPILDSEATSLQDKLEPR
jgi:hypothetical protein